MAFGAQERVCGAKLLPEVQRNLGRIGRTIATFEPVSMLVRQEAPATARPGAASRIMTTTRTWPSS